MASAIGMAKANGCTDVQSTGNAPWMRNLVESQASIEHVPDNDNVDRYYDRYDFANCDRHSQVRFQYWHDQGHGFDDVSRETWRQVAEFFANIDPTASCKDSSNYNGNYIVGTTGANACPAGFVEIQTSADCQLAASAFDDLDWGSAGGWSNIPHGCTKHNNAGKVHYNSAAGAGNYLFAPICTKALCTVPTIPEGVQSWSGTDCGGANDVTQGTTCTITAKIGYSCTSPGKCLTNGQFLSSGACQASPCDASAPPANGGKGNCNNNLASGSTCQPTCNDGYYPSGASSCMTGTLTPATCQACETDCNTCSSSTTCTECAGSKYLYNGDCVNSCPVGHFGVGTGVTGRTCQACKEDCNFCRSSDDCHGCATKYLHGDSCESACPLGYFGTLGPKSMPGNKDEKRICEVWPCREGVSGTGCLTCIDESQRTTANHCATCNSGYYLAGTSCQAQATCDSYEGECSQPKPVKKGSGQKCDGNQNSCNAATCCEACENKNEENCGSWFHYCTVFPDYMHTYCKKTCGICEAEDEWQTFDNRECKRNNLDMTQHADQCYKHPEKDGWSKSYDKNSNALCLNEAACKAECTSRDLCHSIDMHQTKDRCYLNDANCANNDNDKVTDSSNYKLLLKTQVSS